MQNCKGTTVNSGEPDREGAAVNTCEQDSEESKVNTCKLDIINKTASIGEPDSKGAAASTGEREAAVLAVCISERKGTVKHPVEKIELRRDHGIVGDAHAGNWHRQVSLLADESVEKMRERFPEIAVGAFAENILTRGIELCTLPIGTRLRVGPVLLEVTQIGKECHADCAIRQQIGDCVMPREGIFARVIEEGTVRPGDEIVIENHT